MLLDFYAFNYGNYVERVYEKIRKMKTVHGTPSLSGVNVDISIAELVLICREGVSVYNLHKVDLTARPSVL